MKEMKKEINERICYCCGRPVSKLKLFGKEFGEFSGSILVKNWRRSAPYIEKGAKAMEEANKHYENDGCREELEWLTKKYGKKYADGVILWWQAYNDFGSSWECCDCIVLDTDEYFEVLYKSLPEEERCYE